VVASYGDRNRSIAYLLRSSEILADRVDDTLDVGFSLRCEGAAASASREACGGGGGVRPTVILRFFTVQCSTGPSCAFHAMIRVVFTDVHDIFANRPRRSNTSLWPCFAHSPSAVPRILTEHLNYPRP
jgi:hypothetical protein